jgi:cytoskeletal protein RodZ
VFHLQGNGSGGAKDTEIKAARLHELGEYLQRTREANGQSMDEVVEATKIRSRYLQAIEDGDFKVLPGIVYARGFVRGYADYLGLDGAKIAAQYLGSSADQLQEDNGASDPVQTPEIATRRRTSPVSHKKVMAERKRRGVVGTPMRKSRSKSSGIMWVAGVVLLFTAAVVVYTSFIVPSHTQSPPLTKVINKRPPSGSSGSAVAQAQGTTIVHHPQPAVVKFVQTASGNYSAAYSVITSKSLDVVVTAVSGTCWVQVAADGKTIVSSLTLQPGQTQTWKANSSMQLLIGNSSHITMTINGVQAPLAKHTIGGFTYTFNRK